LAIETTKTTTQPHRNCSRQAEKWTSVSPCFKEAWALGQVAGLYIAGTFLAYSNPFIATVLLGLGMVQAGWLGHDYVHGRGPICDAMRYMPTLLNGHGVEWWSQKHSMHHVFTNEVGRCSLTLSNPS